MGTKLKILYLVTQAEWGGAQRYVYDLATSIKGDFEVAVAAGQESTQTLLERLEAEGIKTFTLQNMVRKINPRRDLRCLFEIRKLLKNYRPSILHANSAKAGVLGALAAAGLGTRVVYTVHGWSFLEPIAAWKRTAYFLTEKLACLFRDATILLGKAEMLAAQKRGLACGISKIILHGIDEPRFLGKDDARRAILEQGEKTAPAGARWIGAIANLYPAKDIPNLLLALSKLNENYFAVIIGDGPERAKIESLALALGLENRLLLAGRFDNAAKFLPAFDIFVQPSAKEGLPYSILEAASAGLPIAATNVGNIEEMIQNEKNGLLVPAGNPDALSGALKKLLSDNELRSSLAVAAKETFKSRFQKTKMLQAYLELYRNLSNRADI